MIVQNHPIYNLTAKLNKHDALNRSNLGNIAVFYAKLIMQEPLRLLEKITYGDKIKEHSLSKDPIFIIGHWRSGTSFLQYLLGQDPQFGYMNKFQVVFPDVFLYSEDFLKPLINRIPQTLNIIRDAQNMSINLELDSPSEIEIALTTMISPASLHWGHIFPGEAGEYFSKYLFFEHARESEIAQWKNDYHHLIKKVSLKNKGRQLLIKSPGNASRTSKLLELYPNARFIFIHRNPYDVFYSSKKLWKTLLDNLALQPFSRKQMEDEIINIYEDLILSYLDQRKNIPEGQLAEIRFNDFVNNPVEQLSEVYNTLDLNGFKEAETAFKDFLTNKTNGKSSQYNYEDHIIEQLNENWEFAFRAFNYPMKNTSSANNLVPVREHS